jgi:hypothetical protein
LLCAVTYTTVVAPVSLAATQPFYARTQVKFPDSTIQPALAPFVSLINHSPWPHIVHFSTVHPRTRTLDLSTFRPLQQGQQAYLSYGPLPNAQLLLFYGFAAESNPFEEAALIVQWPSQQQQQDDKQKESAMALLQQLGLWPQQQLQQQQPFVLTQQQPLPAGLLPCLRVMCATAGELEAVQQSLKDYHQQQQQQATGLAAGSSSSSSAGVRVTKPGRSSKAAKQSNSTPKQNKGSSSSSSNESGPSSAAELQAAWAAAATWQAVLGKPLSNTNEAAAQRQLQELLAASKQPYEACLGKISKRRQLQALLQQQQGEDSPTVGSSSSSSADEGGFLQGLETLCKGMLRLFDTCGAAAAAGC